MAFGTWTLGPLSLGLGSGFVELRELESLHVFLFDSVALL